MKRLARLLLCLSSLSGCHTGNDVPIYYSLPDFSLTDQAGKAVTLHDLTGKVWVADFIFTHCAGTCPLMTQEMHKLQEALPSDIRLVSFTVDPERDTPRVLAAYAEEHGANSNRWLFLTGDKQALYDVCMKGFRLPLDAEGGTPSEPVAHSTRFVLVDKHNQIRGYYSGTEDEELKRLASDAKRL